MADRGLTHIALVVSDLDRSLSFYRTYADMEVVHRRDDPGGRVAWVSDGTRPFVLVLLELSGEVSGGLPSPEHLGVACESRDEVDRLCARAEQEGVLLRGPEDAGPPVGYWAFLRDPDGHILELSFGQEVGLAVVGSRQNGT